MRPRYIFHHQRKDPEVAVAVVVPVVVVAVEPVLVKVAEVEPVAVRVEGQNMPLTVQNTTNRPLIGRLKIEYDLKSKIS